MAITAAGGAFAQPAITGDSAVQLYGRLDLSVNSVRVQRAGTTNTLSSDTSMWGMRGTEQLGDGMLAYFKLESGISADNGNFASATPFNRESYVGIGSPKMGYLELGEHWAPGIWLTVRVDPFNRVQMGASETLLQGAGNRGYNITQPNSAQYITPDMAGFRGRLLYQFGEGAPTRNRAVALDYTRGPLYIGAMYDVAEVSAATVGLTGIPVRSKTSAVGALYSFPVVRVSAYVQQNHVDGLKSARGWLVGASVPAGTGEIKASYVRTNNPGFEASQVAVGYNYFLSKRTTLYTTMAKISNEKGAKFALWPATQDMSAAAKPTAGADTSGVQVGIRHTF
ncbi:MAG TPA: porin [Ramlibacter sp.]|nr:porin [Ramlibacter sp.]